MRFRSPLLFVAAASLGLNALALLAMGTTHAQAQGGAVGPAPQCLVGGNGDRACGYGCISAYGAVRCAQTPQGVCTHGSDVLACWDPPALVRVVGDAVQKRTGRAVPKPTCVTAGGKTACGYQCLTGFDQVQCAQTPWGTCKAGDGSIACWDPPAAVLASFRDAARIPDPICSTAFGQIACGYQCAATGGKIACAQTPEGTCRAEQDKATCWDPPLESRGVLFDPATARACMENATAKSCGYHCVASSNRLVCASTEQGVCLESKGELACR